MTREEAIKMLKAKLECMTRDVSGSDDDCNHKRCDECHLNYEKGNMGEQKEYLNMAIKALEQEPILDKIRAEIEQNAYPIVHGVNNHEKGMTLYGILQVIDKYKAESEDKE